MSVNDRMTELNDTASLNTVVTATGNGYTSTEMVFLYMAMISLSVFTVVGNILVFVAYFKNKELQTTTNYFILSLSVADVTIGLISVNFYTVFLAYGYWPLSAVWCDFWLSCDYWCCQASVLNLVVISIDRYFSLSSPMSYRAKRSDRGVKIAIMIVWVVSFFVWVPWIISYQYIQEGGRTVPSDNCYIQFLYDSWYVTIITAMVGYYGPILIMLIIYIRVYVLLLGRRRKVHIMTSSMKQNGTSISMQPTMSQTSEMFTRSTVNTEMASIISQPGDQIVPVKDENVNFEIKSVPPINKTPSIIKKQPSVIQKTMSDHNRATKLLILIICAYAITWLPYDLFAIIAPFCATCISVPWWHFGYIFCYVNSFLNPFCYAFGNKKFKKTFKNIFLCRSGKTKDY